jgi:pimeloyl-ACP methyl ester carboxylesterase
VREEAILFGDDRRLSGVITDPAPGTALPDAPAAVLLHAGRIHRVGPNRIYVALARALASLGFTVLRFDLSGIGESDVRRDNTPFQEAEMQDVAAALDFLGSSRGADQFVLMGLCSGAALSAFCAAADPRVSGVVLINIERYPITRRQQLRAYGRKVRRYWWKVALRRPVLIVRAFRARGPVQGLLAQEDLPVEQDQSAALRILAELRRQGVRVLIVYSEAEVGLDYLQVIAGRPLREAIESGDVTLTIVPGADHVFTVLASQRRLVEGVSDWFVETYVSPERRAEPAGVSGRAAGG